MRKLIVIEFISLDGVIQAPGGPEEDPSGGFLHGGWIGPFSDSVSSEIIQRQMELPFDLLLGRKTFDIWAPYWPLHDDLWPNVNKARKYVVSRTLRSHAWQPTTFIAGDVAREVRKLKEGAGLDLHVYGSAELFQTLFREELVDELWLRLHPITLGGGKRLFAEGSIPSVFTLAKSVVTTRGVLFLDYRR